LGVVTPGNLQSRENKAKNILTTILVTSK
jgi:hypothetical protein